MSLLEALHQVVGQAPAGFEFLEYVFLMLFVLAGVCILSQLIMKFFSKFTK